MTLRVVAAVSRDLGPRIRAILPDCELRLVATGSELVQALDEARCDLLIVEIHYDESAAAAALKIALARDVTCNVVCIRDLPFAKLARAALDALRIALGGVGAQAFVDLLEYPDDAAGNARVCALLERLMCRT